MAENPSESVTDRRVLMRFTIASMALMVATMVSNLAVIRWLLPEETGIWQTLVLAQSYFAFAQLGFFNGLNREYPFWVGRGDPQKARKMAATAQLQGLVCSALGALTFFGAILFFTDSPNWPEALVAMGVVTGSGFYREYLAATYRTSKAFTALARVFWIQAALLVLTVPLVYWLRFDGLCIRLALVAIVVVVLMHWNRPVRVGPQWDIKAAKALLSAGAPLLALSYLVVLANGFDRVILLAHAGVAVVGLFAPAIAVKNAMQALPMAVNQYLSPKLSQRLGATNDPKALWSTSWRATLAICAIMVPIVAIGWFLLPPAIRTLFPRYEAAILPAQLLLVSGVFTGISAGTAVLAALKSWRELIIFNVASLLLLYFLPNHFAQTGSAMEGVATGWLVARAILLPLGLGLIYMATHRRHANLDT